LTGEIAARFGMGYAPDGWQNLQAVFPDYNADELKMPAWSSRTRPAAATTVSATA
jgi:hypothetical protein